MKHEARFLRIFTVMSSNKLNYRVQTYNNININIIIIIIIIVQMPSSF